MATNKHIPVSNDTANALAQGYRRVIFRYCLAAALIVITSAICILAKVNRKDFEEALVRQTQKHLMVIAGSEITHMTTRFNNILGGLRLTATNPEVQQATLRGNTFQEVEERNGYCPEQTTFKNFNGSVSAVYRLDANGIVQSRIPWKDRTGTDYSHKPGVNAVMGTHKPYISNLFKTNSGKNTISVCYPIFKDEQFIGVLRALVNMEAVWECAGDSDMGEKCYSQIIDENGVLVVHPEREQIGHDIIAFRKQTYPDHDWSELENIVKRMKQGQEGSNSYHSVWWHEENKKFVRKITVYRPLQVGNRQWSLGITMGYDEISDPVKAHARKLFLGGVFVFTAFVLAFIWFYKTQKEKTQLRSQAESAEKLQEINEKLESEVACRIEVEEG
ncbi:hypothetical protein LCGC14_2691030, partial [marine sediment metagenome]